MILLTIDFFKEGSMDKILCVPFDGKNAKQLNLEEARRFFLESHAATDGFIFDPSLSASVLNCCIAGVRASDEGSVDTVLKLIELISFYYDQLWETTTAATTH